MIAIYVRTDESSVDRMVHPIKIGCETVRRREREINCYWSSVSALSSLDSITGSLSLISFFSRSILRFESQDTATHHTDFFFQVVEAFERYKKEET